MYSFAFVVQIPTVCNSIYRHVLPCKASIDPLKSIRIHKKRVPMTNSTNWFASLIRDEQWRFRCLLFNQKVCTFRWNLMTLARGDISRLQTPWKEPQPSRSAKTREKTSLFSSYKGGLQMLWIRTSYLIKVETKHLYKSIT